jgi:hypothetical protein
MNNATLFFPHEEGDDLFELYEERLFEDKQFFTSKPVLPSLYEKRFQKMEQREKAFRFLTSTTQQTDLAIDFPLSEPKNLASNFEQYQRQRALFMQSVYLTATISNLIKLVRDFFPVFENYTRKWELITPFNSLDVILSKEPEPVQLQKSITAFSLAGGMEIDDAEKLTFEGKEILIQEAKRLSLWRKKEIKNG